MAFAFGLFLVQAVAVARAEEATVAVASNFAPVAEVLARDFASSTEHRITLVAGSTGKLYAQIVRGAPFDVFLAADRARPERLVAESRATGTSRRVYALGRLVLWSASPELRSAAGPALLAGGEFRRLAIANPDLAPYGVAAREVIHALGLEARLAERLVFGENIGQTHALVASGNAELGFVAHAQVVAAREVGGGGWLVPASHHAPIRQEGVLLARAAANPAALAFLSYLGTEEAKRVIEAAGYEVP